MKWIHHNKTVNIFTANVFHDIVKVTMLPKYIHVSRFFPYLFPQHCSFGRVRRKSAEARPRVQPFMLVVT